MSFPSRSQYFADRAEKSRKMRDLATDVAFSRAHGELAELYQSESDKAKVAEMEEQADVAPDDRAAASDEHAPGPATAEEPRDDVDHVGSDRPDPSAVEELADRDACVIREPSAAEVDVQGTRTVTATSDDGGPRRSALSPNDLGPLWHRPVR